MKKLYPGTVTFASDLAEADPEDGHGGAGGEGPLLPSILLSAPLTITKYLSSRFKLTEMIPPASPNQSPGGRDQ
jgi:hypothetical protein